MHIDHATLLSNAEPCPFCRTNKALRFSEDQSHEDGEPPYTYAFHVSCDICGAKGRNQYPIGWCESPEAALEAWNDRGQPMQSKNYHIEPFGPEGQFAFYHGRNQHSPGSRLCLMYDFGSNKVEAHQFRMTLLDLLNN